MTKRNLFVSLALSLLSATSGFAHAQVPATREAPRREAPAAPATAASFTGTYTGTFLSPWAETSGSPVGARMELSPEGRDKVSVQFSILGKRYAQGPCRGTGALKGEALEIRVPSAKACTGRVLKLKAAPAGLAGVMEAAGAEIVDITFRKLRPTVVR